MSTRVARPSPWVRSLRVFWLVATVAGPGVASAGDVTASWIKDTQTASDIYRYSNPGAGQILIYNTVAGASTRSSTDPRVPTPGSFDVGTFTFNALGVSTPKSTLVATSDSWNTKIVQNAVVPPQTGLITSLGNGSWNATITPGTIVGTNVSINYSATTNVIGLVPVAPINLFPYAAYTHVSDPLTLTVLSSDPSGGFIPLSDRLEAGSFNLSNIGGMVGIMTSDLTVNGEKMYDLIIRVLPNFTGNSTAGGVQVQYFNSDGTENTSMESLIRGDLNVDATNQIVSLIAPMTVFSSQITNPAPGDYMIGSDLNVGIAGVPEPASLELGCIAAALSSLWYVVRRRSRA